MKRKYIALFGLIPTFLLAGCSSSIPVLELSQYRNAFAEVQNTSDEILIDFAEAIKNAEKQETPEPAATGTNLFPTTVDSSSVDQPDAVEVRRTALRAIDKFNNVLTTLAEGKSIEAVQNTAEAFVKSAENFIAAATSSTVPGLAAIPALLNPILKTIEKARLREEFEFAVEKGAPVVLRMLDVLDKDRADHLTLRGNEATQRHVVILDSIVSGIRSVRELIQQHSSPGDEGDPIRTDILARLNKALKPMEQELQFKLPIEFTYGEAAKPKFDGDEQVLANQVLAKIDEGVTRFEANVEQHKKLRLALTNYGQMLGKTRDSLKSLVSSLDKPQQFEDVAEDLVRLAFSVKKELTAFREAREAAQ